jgi:hypothetical protein
LIPDRREEAVEDVDAAVRPHHPELEVAHVSVRDELRATLPRVGAVLRMHRRPEILEVGSLGAVVAEEQPAVLFGIEDRAGDQIVLPASSVTELRRLHQQPLRLAQRLLRSHAIGNVFVDDDRAGDATLLADGYRDGGEDPLAAVERLDVHQVARAGFAGAQRPRRRPLVGRDPLSRVMPASIALLVTLHPRRERSAPDARGSGVGEEHVAFRIDDRHPDGEHFDRLPQEALDRGYRPHRTRLRERHLY